MFFSVFTVIFLDSLLLSGMIAAKLGIPGSSKLNQSDEENHSVCSLALKALAQYLSWVPLDTYLTPDLIKILFQYAALPEHAQVSFGIIFATSVNIFINFVFNSCVASLPHLVCKPCVQSMNYFTSNAFQLSGTTFCWKCSARFSTCCKS